MNDYPSFDEQLYEVAGEDIAKRKKSFIIPLILLIAGALLAVWSVASPGLKELTALSSVLMLTGVVVAFVGLIQGGIAFSSKGIIPVEQATGKRIRRSQHFFDNKDKTALRSALADGNPEKLADIRQGDSSGVMLTLYATSDGALTLVQLSEYVPHTYQPASEVYKFSGERGSRMVELLRG